MRKLSVFIILISLLLFIFTGCDPMVYRLNEKDCQNITEIQLIYYENPEAAKINRQADRVIPFDFEKMQIIEIMAEEKKADFLAILPTADFWPNEGEYDSPNGYSLRLVYDDGKFIVVSFYECTYAALFDSEGKIIKNYGLLVFGADDSNQYFITQLSVQS